MGAGFFSDNADPTLAGQRALWEEFRTDVLGTVRNRLILFSLLLCITITLTALILRSSLLSRRKAQKSLSLYKDILESNLCVIIIDGKGKSYM